MDERGFTLTELLVGTAISLALLALIAGIIQSQGDTFSRQSQLGQMQANGRAAVDFISRSVQNAGFNVTRGKRFLAASDHYITMVFDDDNDGAIQNDEVFTYAVSNPNGPNNETFTISPFFDQDGDGTVSSSETQDYDISLILTGPPFNFYLITPDNAGSGVQRNTVARNIDNLIIRYFDKNGDPLPAGVLEDRDGNAVPPYVLPANELNDIRRIEMEIITLSKDEDPNENYQNIGTYLAGSVAATSSGSTSFSDSFHRETFEAVSSPRNLVTAPWGKISLVASPSPISCPDDSTEITASVVDSEGEGVDSGISVTFTTSDGTLDPVTNSTIGSGDASTTLTYDWSSPSVTVTVSASALIDVDGEDYPVFNAIPVSFESGTGIFTDNFDDGDSDGDNRFDVHRRHARNILPRDSIDARCRLPDPVALQLLAAEEVRSSLSLKTIFDIVRPAHKVPRTIWSSDTPLTLKPKPITLFFLVTGLWIFGTGEAIIIASGIGVSPWTVLAQGIGKQTGFSVGEATFVVSILVLFMWVPLRETPGIGKILNAILIAMAIDVMAPFLPKPIEIGPQVVQHRVDGHQNSEGKRDATPCSKEALR